MITAQHRAMVTSRLIHNNDCCINNWIRSIFFLLFHSIVNTLLYHQAWLTHSIYLFIYSFIRLFTTIFFLIFLFFFLLLSFQTRTRTVFFALDSMWLRVRDQHPYLWNWWRVNWTQRFVLIQLSNGWHVNWRLIFLYDFWLFFFSELMTHSALTTPFLGGISLHMTW